MALLATSVRFINLVRRLVFPSQPRLQPTPVRRRRRVTACAVCASRWGSRGRARCGVLCNCTAREPKVQLPYCNDGVPLVYSVAPRSPHADEQNSMPSLSRGTACRALCGVLRNCATHASTSTNCCDHGHRINRNCYGKIMRGASCATSAGSGNRRAQKTQKRPAKAAAHSFPASPTRSKNTNN